MKKFLSRKFIIAVIILLLDVILLLNGKITESGFIEILKWIGGGYMLVNVGNKAVSSK